MNASMSNDLRKQAKKSIDRADDTTVKMILAMLNVQQAEQTSQEQEIQNRFNDYERGRVLPISLDYLEKKARSSHKKLVQGK